MTADGDAKTDWGTRLSWSGALLAVVGLVVAGAVYVANSRVVDPDPVVATVSSAELTFVFSPLELAEPEERSIDPYVGYGTWVDVFDYDPAYNPPTVGTADFAEMAGLGVTTVYLQAARLDERTPDGIVDPWLLADLLLSAHAEGLDVVAWYLPRFGDAGADLERLTAMADFEVLGERFDGVAVDIEWIGDGIDDTTRTARLLELSRGIRNEVGDDPLGAIVPPPVQIEVINDTFWPGFPWRELADSYDVWLPMSYWSFRSDASGYGDGYVYHEESVRRLRANVGDPDALVHGIGGIGGLDGVDDPAESPEPLATLDEIERFVVALADTDSIGGSIYDWNTLEPAVRVRLAELFAPS
jgi:hypothetical protein